MAESLVMKGLLVGVIVILNSFACNSQVVIHSFQELLDYADIQSPVAKQADVQSSIARNDISIQASGLYPKVNAFAAGDYYPIIPTQVIPAEVIGGTPGTYLKAQFGLPYLFMSGLDISMPLVNLEKWAQLTRIKAQYRQVQWGKKVALENLHLQLLQGYYQVLVTKEVAKLNAENIILADELMRIMDARNEAGVVNPSDHHRSRNLQLDVKKSAVDYEQMLEQALNNLEGLLNVGRNGGLEVNDALPQFQWGILSQTKDISNRAAWNETLVKIQVGELALHESRSAALPKLNLNGRYTYNMQTKMEGAGSEVSFNVANVGIRLEVPLFQGNYYRTQRQRSELLLQSARIEQERLAAQLEQQQKDWLTSYEIAYRKNILLNEKLSVTSDNLRIARLNMQEGLMEFEEFNSIFMEQNRARMEYIQNLADGVLYYLLCTQNY